MKKALLGIVLFCSVSYVHAGPYTDDLARCLVESSTPDDKLDLVKWMFGAMSQHPAVSNFASISDSERSQLNELMAGLTYRLLAEDCLDKTKNAVKYEGALAVQSSFQTLGQVAAGELFSHPNVAQGLSELEQFFDTDKFNGLLGGVK